MRNVNLAHGSLYLLGAYLGYEVAQRTGVWVLGVAVGFLALAVVGLLMQIFIFRRLEGDELRQTLVTLGISIVAADLMLAVWTGVTYQIGVPSWLDGAVKLPIVTGDAFERRGRDDDLSALSPGRAWRCHRHRHRLVADDQPHAYRHHDPCRRR